MNFMIQALLFDETLQHEETVCAILADAAAVTTAESLTDFSEALASGAFDVALVAFEADSPDPPAAFAVARLHAPVILIAVDGDAAGAVRAVKAGATDYLVPGPGWEQNLREAVRQAYVQASELNLDRVCQDAPVMMHLIDREGIIRDANPRCSADLGYTREMMIGRTLSAFMTAGSASVLVQHDLPQLWRVGKIRSLPYQYRCHDNAIIDVVLDVNVMTNSAGREFAIVVVYNMQEQRQIEQAEREQRVLAEALRDTTAALNSTLDFDEVLDRILANVARVVPYDTGTIMLIEAGQARIVRNQRSSELGREIRVPTATFDIASTPTLRWMYENALPLAIGDTQTCTGWVELKQSAWIHSFLGVPILDEGQVIGYLTLNSATKGSFTRQQAERLATFAHHASIAIRNARLFDAVQRYASELERRVAQRTEQLKLERNQLQAILESTGEGIVYAQSHHIGYINSAFAAMTGYTPEELVGNSITLIEPDVLDSQKWRDAYHMLREHGIWRDETTLRRKDGTQFEAGVTVSLSGSPDDEMLHTVTVVRDISQEKRLEEEKANFIAVASHELRTPITNILTRLYLMKNQPQELQEHMEVLGEVARRMRRLVEDLLDMSRFERGLIRLECRQVELQQLLSDVVRVQYAEAQAQNITLKIELTRIPQHVNGDVERLAQVMTNLVTNALTYTPAGGEVLVRLTTDKDNAIIMVQDSGVGIAPEHLEQIFEPFVRVNDKVKGTGLGLSIAREIIELHGGEISVKSEPGQGSCFTIKLKLMPVLV